MWLGFVPAAIELGGGPGVKGSIVGSWPEGKSEEGDELYKLHCEVKYE